MENKETPKDFANDRVKYYASQSKQFIQGTSLIDFFKAIPEGVELTINEIQQHILSGEDKEYYGEVLKYLKTLL